MSLSLSPQDVTTDLWYYEEKRGINIVHQIKVNGVYVRTDQIIIPWEMIRTSLARKDKRKLPRKRGRFERRGPK